MKNKSLTFLAISLLLIFTTAFYLFQSQGNLSVDKEILFQISAFNKFSSGQYNGYITFDELAKHGDFGIGTLHGLNGEMIAIDGVFYQIPADGLPLKINSSSLTPYATVTFFEPDQIIQANSLNYSQLMQFINQSLSTKNVICGIKVNGDFEYAKARSVPIQTEPYLTLTEVISHQTIFNLTNISGIAAGFYFPDSMNGVDAMGYHLHFLSSDQLAGGHLLDCIIRNATIELDYTNKYTLVLPEK